MPVKQFMLYLHLPVEITSDFGERHTGGRCLQIDLTSGNIADFLAQIPAELSNDTLLWAAITDADGTTLAFADGVESRIDGTEPNVSGARPSPERAEAFRKQAALWAERRLKKIEAGEDVSGKDRRTPYT